VEFNSLIRSKFQLPHLSGFDSRIRQLAAEAARRTWLQRLLLEAYLSFSKNMKSTPEPSQSQELIPKSIWMNGTKR
jgi:hypothetical protein